MTVPARLSIVTLGVGDLDRSIAVYNALGWEPKSASVDDDPWEIAHDPGFPIDEDGRVRVP